MANVGGVQYLSPQAVQPMPSGGGGGGLGGALAGFQAGYDITKQVKGDIDAKKSQREFDKLISGLGDRPPSQQDFMKIMKYAGPDGANSILQLHNMSRKWRAEDQAAFYNDIKAGSDLMGNTLSMVLSAPEADRMQVFSDVMAPLVANNPRMQEMAQPIVKYVQDGGFNDERIEAGMAMLAGVGRFAEVHDNKLKAKALKQKDDLDRGADIKKAQIRADAEIKKANAGKMSAEQLIRTSIRLAKEFGGKPESWEARLKKDGHKWVGQGVEGTFVSIADNQPLDLGSYSESMPNPNALPLETPSAGESVADSMVRRKRARR